MNTVPVSVLHKDLFQFSETVIYRDDMVLTIQDTVTLFFVCICKMTLLPCLMCECCPAQLVRPGYLQLDVMQWYILSFPKNERNTIIF